MTGNRGGTIQGHEKAVGDTIVAWNLDWKGDSEVALEGIKRIIFWSWKYYYLEGMNSSFFLSFLSSPFPSVYFPSLPFNFIFFSSI